MKVSSLKITYLSIMYVINSIFKALLPLFFVYIFNHIMKKEYMMAIILLVIQFMGYILYVLYNNLLNNTTAKISEQIKNDLKFNLALKFDSQKAKDINSNKVLAWTINEVEDVISNYVEGICGISESISLIVLSVTTLIYFNYLLFIACIVLSAFIYYIPQLFVKSLNEKQKSLNIAQGIYFGKIKNTINGIMNFVYSNKEQNFISNINNKSMELKEEYLKTYKFNQKYNVFIDFIRSFANITLCAVCYIMIYYNYITIGVFTAIIDVFNNFNQSIVSFSALIAKIKVGKSILNKFESELVTYEQEKTKILNKIDNITFEDYGIKFGDKNIFENFSFEIEKNKKYIIFGKSGSGKSSLIKSILGLISYDGMIKINEEDINLFSKKSIYDNISYISDENKILYANIYDNIALFSKYDKPKIDKILKILNLDNIDKDKILDELNISTGEKQRINLARFLYNPKKVLILDEALANIDASNRNSVIDYINKEKLTLLYITHHIEDRLKYDLKFSVEEGILSDN